MCMQSNAILLFPLLCVGVWFCPLYNLTIIIVFCENYVHMKVFFVHLDDNA